MSIKDSVISSRMRPPVVLSPRKWNFRLGEINSMWE
jgi:hypothetical protein